jgi:hypothetical protein
MNRHVPWLLIVVASWLALDRVAPGAEESQRHPLAATVTTAEGEQAAGQIGGLADGALTLSTDPPRSFRLTDLERIQLGVMPAEPASGDLVWVGQDNHDLVQVGGASGGNGIQDVHLRVGGLSAKAIKQVIVVCRMPKQLRVWRLDTSQSPHWRLAIVRTELSPQADMYLEPPADDSFGQKFELSITYADDTTTKSSIVATTHTSDALKIDRSAGPGASVTNQAPAAAGSPGGSEVLLADQGLLRGNLVSLNPQSLVLHTTWDADLEVAILHAKGVWFGRESPTGGRAKFDQHLLTPGPDDVVLLIAPDQSVAQVAGVVQSLDADKLALRFEGEDRTIKRDRLLGIVFAAHPKLPPIEGAYQAFLLDGGQSLTGHWLGVGDDNLEIETPWHVRCRIPAGKVSEIRTRNGRLVYLSDLEPTSVEESPYFGRLLPWGRDRGFDGNPPAMKGSKPFRSLAVHSRCVLTYALDEQFETFRATVGFDDSSQGRGRVVCRVSVDGRERFAQSDLRADRDPVPVEVEVAGAKLLTLEVDFGEGADVGDRVLWAEPRLFRAADQP